MPDLTGTRPTILIAGASRGLGLALAAEFARRGWCVVGTARGPGSPLHDLVRRRPDRVTVETLDVDSAEQVAALRERLAGRRLDVLFVNAGTTTRDEHVRVGAVAPDEFARVMATNVLGPMRTIEALADLVPADGLIGAMSSGQGSVADNEKGGRDVYRASKAALNTAMRSFAARETEPRRALLLLAPGWIRTELGGPDAPYTLEESAPKLVDVMLAKRGRPGLEYLDRDGRTVAW